MENNRVSNKILWWAFITYLCLLSLICGTGCENKAREQDKKNLRIAVWGPPEALEKFGQNLKEYETINPDVKLSASHVVWGSYENKLLVESAGGSPPDVAYMIDSMVPGLAEKNRLLPLDSLLTDSGFDLSKYYDKALEGFRWKGKLYGLPLAFVSNRAVYYNKTLFDKANLSYPDNNWTWDDFLEKAKELTRDFDGDGRIDQWGCAAMDWQEAILQNGGNIFNDDCTGSLLDTPAVVEALQFLQDLEGKYHVSPRPVEMPSIGFEGVMMFASGKVAMMPMGAWARVLYRQSIKNFDWDVAPLPGEKRKAMVTKVVGAGIMADSRYHNDSWKLLKFLASENMTAEGETVAGSGIPAIRRLAETGNYIKIAPPEHMGVFLDCMDYTYLSPRIVKWNEIKDIIQQKIEEARHGQISIEEACHRMRKQVDDLLTH